MKCRFSIMVAISAICSTRSMLRCDDLQKPIRTQAFILQGVRCVITFIAGIGLHFAHGCWRSNRKSYVQKDALSPFSARLHDGYLLAQGLTGDLPLSRTDLGRLFQTFVLLDMPRYAGGRFLENGGRSVTKQELWCAK